MDERKLEQLIDRIDSLVGIFSPTSMQDIVKGAVKEFNSEETKEEAAIRIERMKRSNRVRSNIQSLFGIDKLHKSINTLEQTLSEKFGKIITDSNNNVVNAITESSQDTQRGLEIANERRKNLFEKLFGKRSKEQIDQRVARQDRRRERKQSLLDQIGDNEQKGFFGLFAKMQKLFAKTLGKFLPTKIAGGALTLIGLVGNIVRWSIPFIITAFGARSVIRELWNIFGDDPEIRDSKLGKMIFQPWVLKMGNTINDIMDKMLLKFKDIFFFMTKTKNEREIIALQRELKISQDAGNTAQAAILQSEIDKKQLERKNHLAMIQAAQKELVALENEKRDLKIRLLADENNTKLKTDLVELEKDISEKEKEILDLKSQDPRRLITIWEKHIWPKLKSIGNIISTSIERGVDWRFVGKELLEGILESMPGAKMMNSYFDRTDLVDEFETLRDEIADSIGTIKKAGRGDVLREDQRNRITRFRRFNNLSIQRDMVFGDLEKGRSIVKELRKESQELRKLMRDIETSQPSSKPKPSSSPMTSPWGGKTPAPIFSPKTPPKTSQINNVSPETGLVIATVASGNQSTAQGLQGVMSKVDKLIEATMRGTAGIAEVIAETGSIQNAKGDAIMGDNLFGPNGESMFTSEQARLSKSTIGRV